MKRHRTKIFLKLLKCNYFNTITAETVILIKSERQKNEENQKLNQQYNQK